MVGCGAEAGTAGAGELGAAEVKESKAPQLSSSNPTAEEGGEVTGTTAGTTVGAGAGAGAALLKSKEAQLSSAKKASCCGGCCCCWG